MGKILKFGGLFLLARGDLEYFKNTSLDKNSVQIVEITLRLGSTNCVTHSLA